MPPTAWKEEEEFFRSFLLASDQQRREYEDEDREALENVLVLPYSNKHYRGLDSTLSGSCVLKDPESHIINQTLLATQLLGTLGRNGFVDCQAVGAEDAYGAELASALLHNAFGRPNNFRSMAVTYQDMYIFGACVLMPSWLFQQGLKPTRSVQVDPFTGVEQSSVSMQPAVFRDDIQFVPIGVEDFFPDPGHETIDQMLFAARRFVIPKYMAMQMVEEGRWKREQVEQALRSRTSKSNVGPSTGTSNNSSKKIDSLSDATWRESMDRPTYGSIPDIYEPVVGYEGWGETPYLHSDGQRRRRLTMLNGVLVESRPSPVAMSRHIPMFDFVVSPIRGRWRGVSPAKINRYMQSFADAMLMVAADGAAKRAQPPVIYDENAGIRPRQLKNWRGPIRARNINGVRELKWDADVGGALSVLSGLKSLMQMGSSATPGLQGQPFSTKRMSATESQLSGVQQMARPEMQSELLEREMLPALGLGMFEMYQLFIESSEDLARRVGRSTIEPGRTPRLSDIQGQYDIRFIGSRKMRSQEQQLLFMERAFQVFGSVPGAAPMFPWAPALAEYVRLLDLPKLEAMINNPNGVEDFVYNSLIAQGGAAGGGANVANPANSEASGLQPAQAAGFALPAA